MPKPQPTLYLKRATNGFVITTLDDELFDSPHSIHTTTEDLLEAVRAWASPPAPARTPKPRPARKPATR